VRKPDNLPPSSANITQSGSLNLPEPSGSHRHVMRMLFCVRTVCYFERSGSDYRLTQRHFPLLRKPQDPHSKLLVQSFICPVISEGKFRISQFLVVVMQNEGGSALISFIMVLIIHKYPNNKWQPHRDGTCPVKPTLAKL
jgi:hypothetical protein